MFDVAWTEMAVIAVLALIVLGPKELPVALKTFGRWVGRARALAGEFKRGLDDIAREAELDEVKRQIDVAGSLDLRREIENRIDPTGEVADAFDFADGSGARPAAGPDASAPETAPKEIPDRGADAPPAEPTAPSRRPPV